MFVRFVPALIATTRLLSVLIEKRSAPSFTVAGTHRRSAAQLFTALVAESPPEKENVHGIRSCDVCDR